MSRQPPGTRADYRAFVPMPTRWRDNDAYGHMNNAVYIELFDSALGSWQIAQGIRIHGEGAMQLVVVESGCRYHAEAGYPDALKIGLRLAHLGRSSFKVDLAMFRNDEDTACAEGFFSQVHMGAEGRPEPMPDLLRDALTTLGDG